MIDNLFKVMHGYKFIHRIKKSFKTIIYSVWNFENEHCSTLRTRPMLHSIQFNLTVSSKACRLDFRRWTILINQLTSQSKFSTKNSNIFLLIKYVSFVSKSVIVRIIWFQLANERWSTACRMKLICSGCSIECKNRQVSEYVSFQFNWIP